MKKHFCITLLALLLVHAGLAQDAQFPIAPQTINPAMTGFTSADVRASLSYYSQSPSYSSNKHQTALLSVDAPLLRGRLPKGDALGIGVFQNFYDINTKVDVTYFGLSAAYHKALGRKRNQYVSAAGCRGKRIWRHLTSVNTAPLGIASVQHIRGTWQI
jgi:hypothetical protein